MMKNVKFIFIILIAVLYGSCKKEAKCDEIISADCDVNLDNTHRLNNEQCTCECNFNYDKGLTPYKSPFDGSLMCYFPLAGANDPANYEYYISDDTSSDIKNGIFRNISVVQILLNMDVSSKGFSIWYPYQGNADFEVANFGDNNIYRDHHYSWGYDFYMNKPYGDTLFFDKSYLVNGFDHTYWACPEAHTSNGYKVVQFGGYAVRKPTGLEWYLPLYAAGTDPLDITNGVATPYTIKHLFMPKLTL